MDAPTIFMPSVTHQTIRQSHKKSDDPFARDIRIDETILVKVIFYKLNYFILLPSVSGEMYGADSQGYLVNISCDILTFYQSLRRPPLRLGMYLPR